MWYVSRLTLEYMAPVATWHRGSDRVLSLKPLVRISKIASRDLSSDSALQMDSDNLV